MTLIFDNVSYRIHEHVLLDSISFTAKTGQVIALLGPNGAGKSTLLDLAGGLKTASSGDILLDNIDIKTINSRDMARRRALLSQQAPVIAAFSVTELVNLAFQCLEQPLLSQTKNTLVKQAINLVGLDQKRTQNIQSLSGGELQRAHLARILLQLKINKQKGCQLLLLDEPLSAQDPAQHLLVFSLIKQHARKGGIVIIILHDLNWASAIADHIILLKKGSIYAQGPPQAVLTDVIIGPVFGLPSSIVKYHKPTNRPYLIPHDMLIACHNLQ